MVKDSVEARQTVKHLMEELQSMPHDTEAFDAKFHELIQHVGHHVAEEERAMFPLAAQELSEDLDDMLADMQEMKADMRGA